MKQMERENVIKGLQIERECVSRDCDRDCGKCDLVQERDWLLSVYDDAIALLKEQEAEIRQLKLAMLKERETEIQQLRLALDIAKGTCKGIKSGGG